MFASGLYWACFGSGAGVTGSARTSGTTGSKLPAAIQPPTKPGRIFSTDETSLDLVASLLKHGRAELFHEAWLEYLRAHRAELALVFRETQAR